jgi:2-amino-4-hydroxy-6-hydroxymethyldihydropteridine diphosphokinase
MMIMKKYLRKTEQRTPGTLPVYFSLGSNIGNREKNIMDAILMMDNLFGTIHSSLSDIIETAPVGFRSDNRFLNCVVEYQLKGTGPGDTEKNCLSVLDSCMNIERSLGRKNSGPLFDSYGTRIYKDRPIDIDILFYGDAVINNSRLTVPHPRMSEREFVMKPLSEIAGGFIMSAFPELFESK